jgi:DUF4097 and DUF4098 domain-containing protein YvlB
MTASHADRTERVVLWILLVLGALMMLAAGVARGDETAHRTDRISATLPPGSVLRIENVSGDIVAAPGPEFSAVATVVVVAPTKARAEEVLRDVRLVQSRDGNDLSIETQWGDRIWRFQNGRQRWRREFPRWADARVNAKIELKVPAGVSAKLETVNGDLRARDLDGDLRLRTVNGAIEASGVRRSLDAQTVNGNVVAAALAIPAGRSIELGTVNGAVRLTLPKDSRFDFSASTMHGSISSTFALPPKAEEGDREVIRKRLREDRRGRRIVVTRAGEDEKVVDLRDLEKELEDSMRDIDVEIRRATESVEDGVREGIEDGVRQGVREGVRGTREGERAVRELWIVDPRRSYSGKVGDRGGRVKLSALNGGILLLAGGTRAEEAKPLVSGRRSFAVTVPKIEVHVPEIRVQVPNVDVHVPPIDVRVPEVRVRSHEVVVTDGKVGGPARVMVLPPADAPVVRGNVAGDFLSTSGTSSYRIGDVSGKVRILTHSGEIQVGSIGSGAEVKTLGGDIELGPIRGDLAAQTLAGNVRAISVAGAAKVETSGGDIRIDRVDGGLAARTGGGDIVVPLVIGGVDARTAGGDVQIAVAGRQLREGVSIVNGGGDVNLTLPADFRGNVELTVTDADPEEIPIRSDFPEITISRREGTVKATGAVNGGGQKVRVQTTSGTIRLRRGPAASK